MNAVLGLTELTTRPHHLLHQQGITASPFNSLSVVLTVISRMTGHQTFTPCTKPQGYFRNDWTTTHSPPHTISYTQGHFQNNQTITTLFPTRILAVTGYFPNDLTIAQCTLHTVTKCQLCPWILAKYSDHHTFSSCSKDISQMTLAPTHSQFPPHN